MFAIWSFTKLFILFTKKKIFNKGGKETEILIKFLTEMETFELIVE